MAARFYAPQPETIVAVTGTNGKTSVTVFTRQIWEQLGHRAASLGTIGIVAPASNAAGSLTTPDPVTLHRDARRAGARRDRPCRARGFEPRPRPVPPRRARARRRRLHQPDPRPSRLSPRHGGLFRRPRRGSSRSLLPRRRHRGAQRRHAEAIAAGRRCRASAARPLHHLRRDAGADLRLVAARRRRPAGQELELDVLGRAPRHLPAAARRLPGEQCAGGARSCARRRRAGRRGPRRAGAARRRAGPAAACRRPCRTARRCIVDYAHTPDALETVLTALRPHCRGPADRASSAAAATATPASGRKWARSPQRLADVVIVTDDNPRSEDPAAIRRAILAACPEAAEIGDRALAIRRGLAALQPGDVLLIAGKGHERGQIIAGVTHPFDDASAARDALPSSAEDRRMTPLVVRRRGRGRDRRAAPARDWTASGVSIDSRSVAAGDLFVALVGPNFDGHDFVADASPRAPPRRWWRGCRRASPRTRRCCWSAIPCRAGGARPRGAPAQRGANHRRHRQRRQDRHQGGAEAGAWSAKARPSLRPAASTTSGACRCRWHT